MTTKDIIRFLRKHKAKAKDYFEEMFSSGNYREQDTQLEKDYTLEDGWFNTTVDEQHNYVFIGVWDEYDNFIDGNYITFAMYERLLNEYKKEG